MTNVIKDLRKIETLPPQTLKRTVFFFDTNSVLYHPDTCLEVIKKTELGEAHFRISDVVLQELIYIVNHGFNQNYSGINIGKVKKVIKEIESKHHNLIIRENPKIIINALNRLADLTSKKVVYELVVEKGEKIIDSLRNPHVNIDELARLIERSALPIFEKIMLKRLNGRLNINHFKNHILKSKNNLIHSINSILNFIYREVRLNQGKMGNRKILQKVKETFDRSLKNDIHIASHFLAYEHSGKAMLTMDKDVQELIDLFEIWQQSH